MENGTDSIPVAIIGGGAVGLTCSILLSLQNIPHHLYERHPGTAVHPKAISLNQRTTEIFARCGVLDVIYAHSAPVNRSKRTAWYTSLGPSGREIISRPAFGGGKDALPRYVNASPCKYVLCPQIRLEPIVLARARELNPHGIFHNHEVTDVRETPSGIELTIFDRTEKHTSTVMAKYALACDGGRSMATSLGLEWQGEIDVVDMVAAHFRAPLSTVHPDPRNFLTWFINPELGGSIKTGYLYHLGPYDHDIKPWGVDSETEEWNFGCAILPHEQKHFTEETMLDRMRNVLKIPNLKLEIVSLSHWFINCCTTSQFHTPGRRVFMVGDAAHKMPPWGGLGLNTGIQDADNICWKLAWALNGGDTGFAGLLKTYDEERRPVARRNAWDSLANIKAHGGALDKAIGILPTNDTEQNVRAVEDYFDTESPNRCQKDKGVAEAMRVLDLEFFAQGNEVGWFYPSADLNHEGAANRHDGQLLEDGKFNALWYHPSTIPGHHLPHAWLVDQKGARRSTLDLIRKDKFVLITESELWKHVEHDLVHVFVLQEESLRPEDDMWNKVKGIRREGAVLVRPDGILAWRWMDAEFLEHPELTRRVEVLIDRILRRL